MMMGSIVGKSLVGKRWRNYSYDEEKPEPIVAPIEQPRPTGVLIDGKTNLKLDKSPHPNCVTLIDQQEKPLIVSIEQFRQMLQYVYVKEKNDNMDHNIDLPADYFKGVKNLCYNVNDEGMKVWEQDNPTVELKFGWDVAKDMCTPRGMTGAMIELFLWDYYEVDNFYAYVGWLKNLRDSNRIWEIDNNNQA